MIRKLPNRKYLLDFRVDGRGSHRFRKTFATKREANQFKQKIITKYNLGNELKPKKETRRLLDLCEIYYQSYGNTLKDHKKRLQTLKNTINGMGNPRLRNFNQIVFSDYRQQRLNAGVSKNTVNHEHAYLNAMLMYLIDQGHINTVNPLKGVKKYKIEAVELTYLTTGQIKLLLDSLKKSNNPDTYFVAKICLATGARWSEAEKLKCSNIKDEQISYYGTKSGKPRVIPISQGFYLELSHLKKGKKPLERLFSDCYEDFRRQMDKIDLTLPKGQLSHVLRHTFASHFMMNGGNIIVLKTALGHSTLAMTMRYAHFAPDHLEQVRIHNPLH